MQIVNLNLINFRSYSSLNISFNKNINIFYGNNGEGKTNLVEAIYLLSLTKSFRINNDKYLIKKGEKAAKVVGEIGYKNDLSKYTVVLDSDGKQVSIDNNKVDKISEYVSRIPIVIFTPKDTEIVMEAPDVRRKMLNIEISQIYREYMLVLLKYNKVLKQRNAYLKQLYTSGMSSKEYLDVLTKKIIEYGKSIYNYRREFIENINKYISDIYLKIFGEGIIKVNYKSEFQAEEKKLLDYYRKNYSREMAFGKTLYGIHHDDFEFILDENRLKEIGSQGQMKNAIISFKLSEINLIKDIKDDYPILILDDLFSELDNEKVKNIYKLLDNNVQTFITTTDIKKIPSNVMKNSSIFKIVNKQVEVIDNE